MIYDTKIRINPVGERQTAKMRKKWLCKRFRDGTKELKPFRTGNVVTCNVA
jgi:hypothetical protein